MTKGIKHTTESFIAASIDKWGSKFGYDKVVYVDHKTPLLIKCRVHGYVETTAKQHLMSKTEHGCPRCGIERSSIKRAAMRIAKYANLFYEKSRAHHGDTYNYDLVVYRGQNIDVDILCKKHGVFQQKPQEHWTGCGCQKCAVERTSEAQKKPFTVFVAESNELHENKYTYDESTYVGANLPTRVICKTHGEFWCSPSNHTDKISGCSKCSSPVSKVELVAASWFAWDKLNDRTILGGKELDMVSDKNKFAVEINGVYWHSETRGKDQHYHNDKRQGCLDKGYNLLQFYDVELDNKPEIVKSMIANKFGTSARLHARKCSVSAITYAESRVFMNDNHINGSSVASVSYGLFHDSSLVAVMTFAKPRFSDHDWEMIRFANKCGICVVGGASKLFSTFTKDVNPKNVVTYANLRYSNGGVYANLGFVETHQSKPNYDYYKGSVRVSRYAAQKHKLPKVLGDKFDQNKSETQNMLDNGFHKVYDCGNKVFEWTNKGVTP